MYAPGEQCCQDQNEHCGIGHDWNEPIEDPDDANCKCSCSLLARGIDSLRARVLAYPALW